MPRPKAFEPETAPSAIGLEHPHRRELERFLRGDSPREEARAVVRHLLKGCPECVKVSARAWRFADQKPTPESEPLMRLIRKPDEGRA